MEPTSEVDSILTPALRGGPSGRGKPCPYEYDLPRHDVMLAGAER